MVFRPGQQRLTSITGLTIEVSAQFSGSFISDSGARIYTIKFRQFDASAGAYVDISQSSFKSNGQSRVENASLITPRIAIDEGDRLELWIACAQGIAVTAEENGK